MRFACEGKKAVAISDQDVKTTRTTRFVRAKGGLRSQKAPMHAINADNHGVTDRALLRWTKLHAKQHEGDDRVLSRP